MFHVTIFNMKGFEDVYTAETESFGFKWNAFGVCFNPNKTQIVAENCTVIEIKTAKTPSGNWVWGCFCCGVLDTSLPTSLRREPFTDEFHAINAALQYFRSRYKKYHASIRREIDRMIIDRCFVQLSLF